MCTSYSNWLRLFCYQQRWTAVYYLTHSACVLADFCWLCPWCCSVFGRATGIHFGIQFLLLIMITCTFFGTNSADLLVSTCRKRVNPLYCTLPTEPQSKKTRCCSPSLAICMAMCVSSTAILVAVFSCILVIVFVHGMWHCLMSVTKIFILLCIWYTCSYCMWHPKKREQQYFIHNFHKFKCTVVSAVSCQQCRENDAKLIIQLLSTLPP